MAANADGVGMVSKQGQGTGKGGGDYENQANIFSFSVKLYRMLVIWIYISKFSTNHLNYAEKDTPG